MSTNKTVFSGGVLAIADILHGHINNDLNNNNTLIQTLKSVLDSKDPNKELSRKMIGALKRRMIKGAKIKSQEGKKIKSINWGSIRHSNETILKSMLAPPVLVAFMPDDVGRIVIPDYPSGTNFTIKYMGLYCREETGDRGFSSLFGSSDEIYIITNAVTIENGQNVVRSEIHPVGDPDGKYGNVDSKDVRNGPIAACWSGTLKSVSLVVTVMEQDKGNSDFYRKEIETIVTLAAEISKYYGVSFAEALIPIVTDLVNSLIDLEDEHVGTSMLIFDENDLKHKAHIKGNEFKDGNKETGILHNSFGFHDEDGEYYTFFTVDADREPIVRPPRPSGENFLINTNAISRDAMLF